MEAYGARPAPVSEVTVNIVAKNMMLTLPF